VSPGALSDTFRRRLLLVTEATVLGLFPSLSREGGIEASGRLAGAALIDWAAETDAQAKFVFYGPPVSPDILPGAAAIRASSSKLGVIRACLAAKEPAKLALVWHVRMIKLLPFVRPPPSRVLLFLFGVEAWQPLGLLNTSLVKRRVNKILTISEFTWREFTNANPALAQHAHGVVPLGIGAPLGEPTAAPDAVPTALMLSRLHPGEDYKGHREVIDAWPHVAARVSGARLCIAGAGALRANLERQAAQLGLQDTVTFTGRVTEAEKNALLRRCRFLAMPSRGEGFGLAYLEAMRLGRPCLVSRSDAGREVVAPPEAGLAADVEERGELVDAICRLLQPGMEWERWSQAARIRYEQCFTATAFETRLKTAFTG
jgi:phosphatidylinositol alpha-1,6-mannosyltransferase